MKNQKPKLDDVLSSWVLDALRRVFGYQDIRNMILQENIKNKGVVYGRTFGAEHSKQQLQTYLKDIIDKKGGDEKYVLFTASNRAYRSETHYQTFVVDYDKKKVWAIDPASKMGEEGIYSSFATTDTIIPFFVKEGWDAGYVKLTNACQSTIDDVFCQTWSLWLQIKFMRALLNKKKKKSGEEGVLKVAKPLMDRYKQLLKFYKKSIAIPEVCQELKKTYLETMKNNRVLVAGLDPKEAKQVRMYYMGIDVCAQVLRMNELDLMTEEQRQSKL